MKHQEYYEIITEQLKRQNIDESVNIRKAAEVCANSVKNGRLIHIFGCGHSQMFAMEAFYRAGGLVQVNPLLIPHFALFPHAKLSTLQERLEGFVDTYVDLLNTSSEDTMIITSISGRNAAGIDMAIKAKQLGMKVIALTSVRFSESTTSRHSSGKLLKDYADIVVDIKCEPGDASLSIEDVKTKFCGTSTVLGMYVIESIMAQTIENCVIDGFIPPIYTSSNVDGGDEKNNEYILEYKDIISCL